MHYRFFYVKATTSQADTEALNQYLSQQRVISIERQFVADGQNSFWSVCVCTEADVKNGPKTGSKAVDYREVLTPEVFAVFSRLRDWRKRLADGQGVPPYAIFTNKQLAQIAQLANPSRAAIQSIEGIGDKRVEMYADLLLPILEEKL